MDPNSTPTPSPKPPLRLSEGHFRRYEGVILQFVQSYPRPIEVDPSPFSPETFSTRFRDAVRSFLANRALPTASLHWASLINPDDLRIAWDGSISTHNGRKVFIGPKQQKPTTYSFGVEAVEPTGAARGLMAGGPTTGTRTVVDPSDEVIRSFVTLLHGKVIQGPIRLEATDPQHPINIGLIDELMKTHDVDYDKVGDTVVLI
jgi:hypothetical protein